MKIEFNAVRWHSQPVEIGGQLVYFSIQANPAGGFYFSWFKVSENGEHTSCYIGSRVLFQEAIEDCGKFAEKARAAFEEGGAAV